ncbi:MAG: PilT/PilU family type 4a pilus ATPase [Vampirovibrionales bacterium]|nr:PilT/PilU family type 4a pilus ATPase [Vampirovibrionales bacterium]
MSSNAPQPSASGQPNSGLFTSGGGAAAPNPMSALASKPLVIEDLEAVLRQSVAQGASDIHLHVGHPPMVRLYGAMQTLAMAPVTERLLYEFVQKTIPARSLKLVDDQKEVDYGFGVPNLARFRANLFYELSRPALVLRIVAMEIPSLEALALPSIVRRFSNLNNGLVLVTGPTGSGKSTTLASLINVIVKERAKHIITVEDPIEYLHTSAKSFVTQREIGVDTNDFSSGVKYALRQDPDVILIGELRDRETVAAALHAAETGHLVFSTLHTSDAVQTIHRIINIFQPHEREPVRMQLSNILRGTISQRLLPKKDNSGRVPIVEVMTATPTVMDYIQQNQIEQIYDLIRETEMGEMVSMNLSLYRAVQEGWIDPKEAMEQSNNPVQLGQMLRGAYQGTASNLGQSGGLY